MWLRAGIEKKKAIKLWPVIYNSSFSSMSCIRLNDNPRRVKSTTGPAPAMQFSLKIPHGD